MIHRLILTLLLTVLISFGDLNADSFSDHLDSWTLKERVLESKNYPSVQLDERLLCDLELLLNGGFAPLEGFLTKKDYDSVVETCRLADGSLWPMPIVLPVDDKTARSIAFKSKVTLKDASGNPLALLTVDDIYKPDLEKECQHVFGTTDRNHPSVERILSKPDVYYIGGKLEALSLPHHYDFLEYRKTPEEVKAAFHKKGWNTIVGFQTRNPLHRCHVALTQYSVKAASGPDDAHLLLHPVIGVTQKGDVDYVSRIKCYEKVLKRYPEGQAMLSALPLAMRMAGPREALWHAIIRKNYGCTHFVVGRDHAGPSTVTRDGKKFYDPYAAQGLVEKHQDELGIKLIKSKEIVYVEEDDAYFPINEVAPGKTVRRLSGTELRRRLKNNEPVPAWFSYPEIIQELQNTYSKAQGMCLYFTGLSGAGKSTLALAMKEKLREIDPLSRPVVIIDGDEIRERLSPDLGFSRKDRSQNVRRVGYVASQIVKCGGIAICANIAPYSEDREYNRAAISKDGAYVECYVNTELKHCEERDVKGLYKLARQGRIKEFTGISDPYEVPENPEITVNGTGSVQERVEEIAVLLKQKDLL